mgnify:CR=1 FL=1
MAKFEVPDTNDSPDLTPMIDVVFLLIVFFMVVAKQVSEQYVELSDPKLGIASNAKIPESPPSRTIISVDNDPDMGQMIYWGEEPIDLSGIPVVVARNPSWKVYLRIHRDIPCTTVADVFEQVLIGGQSKVIFSAFKAEE